MALLQAICAIQHHHATSHGTLQLHTDWTVDALQHHAAIDAGRHRISIIGDKARPKVDVSFILHGLLGVGPALRRYLLHETSRRSILANQLVKELLHKWNQRHCM